MKTLKQIIMDGILPDKTKKKIIDFMCGVECPRCKREDHRLSVIATNEKGDGVYRCPHCNYEKRR